MTEDIIVQSEPEMQDKNQISEKEFWTLSDFELKISQRVRFWFEVCTTRQIWDWKNCNALDFELEIFRHVRFWKMFASKRTTFWFILLSENDIVGTFRAFLKRMIFNWNFVYVTDFELKKYNASYFEFRKIQRVRFWVKNITACQFLGVFLLQFAKFSFNHQNRACFGNVLMYGLGSISQVILLG